MFIYSFWLSHWQKIVKTWCECGHVCVCAHVVGGEGEKENIKIYMLMRIHLEKQEDTVIMWEAATPAPFFFPKHPLEMFCHNSAIQQNIYSRTHAVENRKRFRNKASLDSVLRAWTLKICKQKTEISGVKSKALADGTVRCGTDQHGVQKSLVDNLEPTLTSPKKRMLIASGQRKSP